VGGAPDILHGTKQVQWLSAQHANSRTHQEKLKNSALEGRYRGKTIKSSGSMAKTGNSGRGEGAVRETGKYGGVSEKKGGWGVVGDMFPADEPNIAATLLGEKLCRRPDRGVSGSKLNHWVP